MQRVKVHRHAFKNKTELLVACSQQNEMYHANEIKSFNPKPAIEGIGSAQGTQVTEDNRE